MNDASVLALLYEIRDLLVRIDKRLDLIDPVVSEKERLQAEEYFNQFNYAMVTDLVDVSVNLTPLPEPKTPR